MYKKRKGQITVWLAWIILVFLGLYLLCLRSAEIQSARREAEQVTESSLFSLFSEYEPHLLEDYDLFYLDTSFRSGTEDRDEICRHLWKFTEENLIQQELAGIEVKDFVRATDGEGAVFYNQAVRVMKEKTGWSLAEEWVLSSEEQQKLEEDSKKFQEDCTEYEDRIVDYEDEEDSLEGEAYTWDGIWKQFAIGQVIDDPEQVSAKSISLQQVPSVRTCSEGIGQKTGKEDQVLEKQFFLQYLENYLADVRTQPEEGKNQNYLDYQMEYILWGKESDAENLEKTLRTLLLMREGTNYAFLRSHPEYEEKAELLAAALAGLTGNPALIKSLKQLILLGWAYGESLVEVRQLVQGKEIAFWKGEEDWQVPLSGVLLLIGNPGRYDHAEQEQTGMDYEDFLRMLLTLYPSERLAMRSIDVVEGELQQKEGCERIHIDHCIEGLTVQVWMEETVLERTYRYE